MSNKESWACAIDARKSSTCFKESELWRVSNGQMEGTMEYSSNPKGENQQDQVGMHCQGYASL